MIIHSKPLCYFFGSGLVERCKDISRKAEEEIKTPHPYIKMLYPP